MTMGPKPLISIITLNYNNASVTYRFLESTLQLNYTHYEILVVDMASTLETLDESKLNGYRNTRLIRNPINNGFSGGNNLGIQYAKGEFICLLNNDTIVTPSFLETMLATFALDPEIGIVSPMILQLKDPQKIEYAGFQRMNMYTARTSSIGFNKNYSETYLKVYPTASFHGAAAMLKRSVLELTGPLPEKYFLYYEEWEYSGKARKLGIKIMYNGTATVYHEGSVSTGSQSYTKNYYLNRSRILFMRRNANLFQGFLFILFYTFIAIPKSIIYYLLKNPKGLVPYIDSLKWNLTNKAF